MAIAERRLAAEFNRPGHDVVDHWTYTLCSDGDLQEGIASEAASLAGHLRLGKLVALYDDNHIQLDGPTDDGLVGGRRQRGSRPTAGTPSASRTATTSRRSPRRSRRRARTTGRA